MKVKNINNSHKKLKVGFIGLGLMGNPMAKNLLKAGFDLTVYNRTRKKTAEFRRLGAKVAESPKDIAGKVDILITMITGPRDVKEILMGRKGVVFGLRKNLIVVDMSTIGPKAVFDILGKIKPYNVDFLDAPVTGSVAKAKTGELTIFVGGSTEVYRKARPVLLSMGKSIYYMGDSGSGQAVKLINNHIVASTMVALSEGFLFADLLKLPRQKVADALSDVPALSFFMKLKLPNMIRNRFPVAFSVANMKKDLKLALEETRRGKGNLPMLRLVEKLFEETSKKGLSGKDISAVLKTLSEKQK